MDNFKQFSNIFSKIFIKIEYTLYQIKYFRDYYQAYLNSYTWNLHELYQMRDIFIYRIFIYTNLSKNYTLCIMY